MSDQAIPADKVRELADKYDQDSSGNPERLLVQAIADLRALLPTQQPTTGLLGRWVKDKHGIDAMIESDRVDEHGDVYIVYRDESHETGSFNARVPLDSLTFPHQATKPEDVPAGEAWLVNLDGGRHQRKIALKVGHNAWRAGNGVDPVVILWIDERVELISPLTPERPGAAAQAQEPPKPAWRIEHDWLNLRPGEYVIDCDDDSGVVSEIVEHLVHFRSGTTTSKNYSPFIAFLNRDAATPEAIKEAKRARDKETTND